MSRNPLLKNKYHLARLTGIGFTPHWNSFSFRLFRNLTLLVCVYFVLMCTWFVCCVLTQSCMTFCDPMGCSPPGTSVHGILQVRTLEWVAISLSRGSSWPRDSTHISGISCTGRQILYHWVTWEAGLTVLFIHVIQHGDSVIYTFTFFFSTILDYSLS